MKRASEPAVVTMRLDEIKVGERYRRDMGDIDALAASIGEVGLLHPIVVTPLGQLIAGERRLEACRRLDWLEVPVTVVDLDEIIRGELDENTVRKDFTPSEIAALAKALRPVEELAARERERAGVSQPSANFAEGAAGEVREKIAARTGVSREQVRKIEKVVEAAEREPETFAPLVEEMDRTGKVDRAYRDLQRVEGEREQAKSDGVLGVAATIIPGFAEHQEMSQRRRRWAQVQHDFARARVDIDAENITDLFDDLSGAEHTRLFIRETRNWLDRMEAAMSRPLRIAGS